MVKETGEEDKRERTLIEQVLQWTIEGARGEVQLDDKRREEGSERRHGERDALQFCELITNFFPSTASESSESTYSYTPAGQAFPRRPAYSARFDQEKTG